MNRVKEKDQNQSVSIHLYLSAQIHFITLWKDQAALDFHLEQPYVKKMFENIKERMASFEMNTYRPLLP